MNAVVATVIFAAAILHTFFVGKLMAIAHRAAPGSWRSKVFHVLGEVELVFGLWAIVLILWTVLSGAPREAFEYLVSRNYTEPLFVFVIMTVCATKPVLGLVERVLGRFKNDLVSFVVIMIAGPLLGSLITEPAAMTVTALLLLRKFYARTPDLKFKYAMTGLLFVNISIGGTLTSFAAPPVLMVAGVWNWDSAFMFLHFGWKAIIAIFISVGWTAFRYRHSIRSLRSERVEAAGENSDGGKKPVPWWLTIAHVAFIAAIVVEAHHPWIFIALFIVFNGVVWLTRHLQEGLKFREGLLVGAFLAGLVILGGPQGWWLEPVLARLSGLPLFAGAAGLTALTDNAALTYLGSLVPNLSEASKYALVAGAVTGGGLTVIANAPNPAGYGILNGAGVFADAAVEGEEADGSMSPVRLFVSALVPTGIAGLCYWCF